jgi:hypothetical protein
LWTLELGDGILPAAKQTSSVFDVKLHGAISLPASATPFIFKECYLIKQGDKAASVVER